MKSKSTSNPQIDFEKYVKPYWEKEIQIDNNTIKVERVERQDTKKQEDILSKKLGEILKNNIDKSSKLYKDVFVNDLADLLISDLVYTEFFKGYGISTHKNTIKVPLHSEVLKPLEDGIDMLSQLLQKVPRHMRPKVIEIISYKLYYRREKANVEFWEKWREEKVERRF